VTVDGTVFDLAYGLNGSVKVYSFVARGGAATNFSADLVSAHHWSRLLTGQRSLIWNNRTPFSST
jgi:hypothetical protein